MAIPNFTNQAGLALMRLDHATVEWHFVGWCTTGATFLENHNRLSTYQIWLVAGSGVVTSVAYNGSASLGILQLKK